MWNDCGPWTAKQVVASRYQRVHSILGNARCAGTNFDVEPVVKERSKGLGADVNCGFD